MKYSAHLCLEELVLSPSQEWTPSLGGWHFLRLAEGQGYWLGESSVLDVGPDQVLVIAPMRSGVFRASQLGKVRLVCFRLRPESLSGLLTLNERQFLEKAALKPKLNPIKLEASHPAAKHYASILTSEESKQGLLVRSQLLQVVASCFDWNPSLKKCDQSGVLPASKRIKVLMSELTESELCELSIGDLAKRCGCTTQHFIRLFQNQFGISLRTRQMEVRLLNALQMLLETDLSISEIARKVGCRHLSFFNSQFKKEFGLSPAEYRRQRARAADLDERASRLAGSRKIAMLFTLAAGLGYLTARISEIL